MCGDVVHGDGILSIVCGTHVSPNPPPPKGPQLFGREGDEGKPFADDKVAEGGGEYLVDFCWMAVFGNLPWQHDARRCGQVSTLRGLWMDKEQEMDRKTLDQKMCFQQFPMPKYVTSKILHIG